MAQYLDGDPGRAGQSFVGPEGLARLASSGAYTAPDPVRFRADWHAVAVDGVELSEWRSTPLTGTPAPQPSGPVRLDALIGGSMQYRLGGAVHTAEPGSVHLVHQGRPIVFSYRGAVRLARITLSEEAAPVWLRDSAPLPDGPLPVTTLTAGFVALLDRLTAVLRENLDEPASTTAKAVGVLATALLEEAIPSAATSPADLRERIASYVDRHLGDQDLGPRRLADEFDISLRWLHRVFNTADESIARYIRERRVDAVAALLRTDKRWIRVGELAARFGFAGRDQLTRAFKQRYGMTVNDYLDLVVQRRPLPEPAPTSGD